MQFSIASYFLNTSTKFIEGKKHFKSQFNFESPRKFQEFFKTLIRTTYFYQDYTEKHEDKEFFE